MLFIITIIFAVIGMLVSFVLKSKFATYSKMPLTTGLSGKEVADKMLKYNGIYDVQITCVEGQLTDHYNPANKTVNLSPDVYEGRTVAAAAVAAHECGHAVQHNTAYSMLELRSKLVPIVNISSNLMRWIYMLGFMGIYFHLVQNQYILIGIIVLQSIITAFALITLPVEFDASKRGLAFIDQNRITTTEREYQGAKDALTWAGMTYLVAAIAALAQLLYFILRFTGRRN